MLSSSSRVFSLLVKAPVGRILGTRSHSFRTGHAPGCSCCSSIKQQNIVIPKSPSIHASTARFQSSNPKEPIRVQQKLDEHPEIEDLLENNKKWVADRNAEDSEFFERLGSGQAPTYLYFGCSDSRVPANEILGLHPGEVFVHRNIGNLVPVSDLNALSVLEFAVDFLQVKHIIVTGHYDCGAIRAASKTQDLGLIENWLRNIRDVYRLHRNTLDDISDDEDRHRKLVELNVVEQCLNLYKTGVVQRRRLKTHEEGLGKFAYPRIHGLVFDPSVGLMKKLKINFKDEIKDMKHIYDLYDVKDKV
eukprot:m.3333 g.3333  ORF g.3333 m.3333 type:complete len:304 (+) comp2750_c0_seq1:165-1076(+)